MAVGMSRGTRVLFDDFDGDTLNTFLWTGTASTGGTVEIPATITATDISCAVLTTDTTDGDAAQLASGGTTAAGQWRVQDGTLTLEARVKVDVITTLGLFIGFSDTNLETDVIPMSLSGTTFTTTATTAIGFLFDTNATTDVITAMWVDDDADSSTAIGTLQYTGLAPVADTFYTYRIELHDQGSGNQARAVMSVITDAGVMAQKTFTSTIDRDALLVPYVGHENHGAAAHVTRVDYIEVTGGRP